MNQFDEPSLTMAEEEKLFHNKKNALEYLIQKQRELIQTFIKKHELFLLPDVVSNGLDEIEMIRVEGMVRISTPSTPFILSLSACMVYIPSTCLDTNRQRIISIINRMNNLVNKYSKIIENPWF